MFPYVHFFSFYGVFYQTYNFYFFYYPYDLIFGGGVVIEPALQNFSHFILDPNLNKQVNER